MGSLLYLLKYSLPDLRNIVRELTKVMDQEDEKHYNIMILVLKYVEETRDFGIKLTKIIK